MTPPTGKVDEWAAGSAAGETNVSSPSQSGSAGRRQVPTAPEIEPPIRTLIERLAGPVVPRLASTALVSIPRVPTVDPESERTALRHVLIQAPPGHDGPPRMLPMASPALDRYEPILRVVRGEGQLWRLDAPLGDVLEPGSPAIAVPFPAVPHGSGVLTLFRLPTAETFALEDLLTLTELVSEQPPTTTPSVDPDPPRDEPGPVGAMLARRYLLRDLLTADTPYEVARRLARAAQSLFDAQSCVVYFVEPAPNADRSMPAHDARPSRARTRPILQLAASIGSGVGLTPPWLAPETDIGPNALFATGPAGTILVARLGDDAWITRTQPEGDVLVCVPLRREGELVAILALRGSAGPAAAQTVAVENLAVIAGLAFDIAQRRDEAQSGALALRSELARTRLAQDALVAMIGAPGILTGLSAHAGVLVPGLADGYLVYLAPALLPEPAREELNQPGGPAIRVFSHWRSHLEPDQSVALEDGIDRLLTLALTPSQPPAVEPSGDDKGPFPILLTDADEALRPPGPDPGSGTIDGAAISSLVAVPLMLDQIRIGALVLVTSRSGRRFGRRDVGFLESLARPVSQALAVLLRADRPHIPDALPAWSDPSPERDDVTAVATLATRLLAAEDPDQIALLAAQALAGWRADWSVVELRGEDGSVRTIGAHPGPDEPWPAHVWTQMAHVRDSERGPSRVMSTGLSDLSPMVTWCGTGTEPGRSGAPSLTAPGLASSLSVAIHEGGRVAGVITCLRTDRADPFGLDDLATVETVAATVDEAMVAVRRLERERAESDRLRWLLGQHSQLLRQIADAVIAVDALGTIVYVNDAARTLHAGADLSGTVGDYISRFRPIEVRGQPFDGHSFPLAAVLSGIPDAHGMWVVHPGDDPVVVAGRAAPLRNGQGTITGGVLSLHDVTAEYETALLRQHHLLDLANELLSPMTSIKGWVQYLGQRAVAPVDAEQESRALGAITSQTRTLQRLIDQIAATARLDLDEEDFPRRLASLRDGPSATDSAPTRYD